jgi:CheY-like chemotaxis protein
MALMIGAFLEKIQIMLADDNIAYLRPGNNILSKKFTVVTVPSAVEMFSLLQNNSPGLILIDIEMPEMNGYEAVKLLKSNAETQNIPVIFLTGDAGPDNRREGLRLGAADYIVKPLPPLLLIDRTD